MSDMIASIAVNICIIIGNDINTRNMKGDFINPDFYPKRWERIAL